MSPSIDVALLTDPRFTASQAEPGNWYLNNILQDDGLLQRSLAEHGLTSKRIAWSQPGVDWSQFRCAVFRTIWDYFDFFPQFTAWLDQVSRQTRLCNELTTVRWNMDKHYLADLAQRGVNIVPTCYLEQGVTLSLSDLLTETGWHEAVIKPCVAGGARHTYRVNRHNVVNIEKQVTPLLAGKAFMLQPFQDNIAREGEVSLMMFDGRFTHAIRKTAKAGDFRVQDDFGGTVHPHDPIAEEIALAEQALAACDIQPVYGRVDMVRGNDGRLAIMELELIEPELWLRKHPPAAQGFAKGIAGYLQHT
jgi:glutathione synthase/RimK-type ligase-like ATP-grasp enzyme